jgi:hypothetical protein
MSSDRNGQRFSVPRSRRLTSDLLWFNHAVPQCGHNRICDFHALAEARSDVVPRISWVSLFVRAYALVAAQYPQLRQTWYRWPLAHLYQHSSSVATITIHRDWRGEPWLFWGMIERPEDLSLREIQERLNEFRDGPPGAVFRQQTKLAQFPIVLRRMIWWWNLNVATAGRAKRLGTFFLSTLAGRGTEIQVPPSIHTGCLTFGPLNEAGKCRVTIAYDHRIMDGAMIADILRSLESVLNDQILAELQQIQQKPNGEQAA